MSPNNPPSASSLQQETNQDFPVLHNRKMKELEQDYRSTNRTDDTQANSRGHSAGAMAILQSFNGMEGFMESYGLKIWLDEDVQTARQIIDKMLEYDEQHGDFGLLDEESADGVISGRECEDEMEDTFRVENTYQNADEKNEGSGMGNLDLDTRQWEVSHGERYCVPDELEGDDVGGDCEGSCNREENFDVSIVDREEGCDDYGFGGCEDDGQGCYGDDYDGNDCEGYDYGGDDDECDYGDDNCDYDSY